MKVEKVSYKSLDGINLVGVVHTPNEHPKGIVVMCHGITSQKDGGQGQLLEIGEKLCQAGYKVLRFDFRGHGESDLLSEEIMTYGLLSDLEASIKFMENGNLEIGVCGYSLGGAVSAMYSGKSSHRLNALVLLSPALDLKGCLLNENYTFGKAFFDAGGYKTLENSGFVSLGDKFRLSREFIDEILVIKPYEVLKDVECSVLTIHGTEDKSVPIWVSEKYGTPNENSRFISVKAGHQLVEEKDYVFEQVVNWFNQNL